MKKLVSNMCLLLVLVCMAGCSDKQEMIDEKVTATPEITEKLQSEVLPTEGIEPTKEPKEEILPTGTVAPTITLEPTPTSSEDYSSSREYLMELSIDTEFITIQQMIDDGSITGYVRGETKFLVWKYVAMGINTAKEYRFAVVDYKGDFEGDFFSYDVYIENPQDIEHIGGNIFQIIQDGNDLYMCHNTEKRTVFWYNTKYDIIEGFWDGYALAEYGFGYEGKETYEIITYSNLALISDEGEVIETPLRYYYYGDYLGSYFKKNYRGYGYYDRYDEGDAAYYSNIGKYSEGYFFLNNVFYDIDLNPILDLGEMELVNQPYFHGGYSWIEYKDSGAVWGAYMDVEGNFIEAAQRLYVLD